MAHGGSSVSMKDSALVIEAPHLQLSWMTKAGLMVLIVLGVGAFITELTSGNPTHAWTSLHVNFLYWFCTAAAASCFSAALHICNAQWVRPIQRVFQSALPFMLISPLFLITLYFGHKYLFIWAHEPIPGKGVWLTSEFLFVRNLLAIGLLGLMARRLIHLSIRQDIGVIRSSAVDIPEAAKSRWLASQYDKYVRDWGSDLVGELEKTQGALSRLSPAIVIVYSLVMSLVAFDLIMSVDPLWYSTLFGALYFMTAVYMAMAWTSIGVGLLRHYHPLFRAKVDRRVLHDLGKLLFGFGIFWAYMFWSHYLPIWYANWPEETGFIITRLRVQPWQSVAWVVLGTCFIIPFLLGLNRDIKQMPSLLLATGTIAAVGGWLMMYLLFAPTLFPDLLPFSLTDLLLSLGFMSAFLSSCAWFLARVPLIPIGDLYRAE